MFLAEALAENMDLSPLVATGAGIMSDYFCPKCGARLAEDFLYTAGDRFDCPECDRTVRLATVAPDLANQRGGESADVDVSEFKEEDTPSERIECRVADGQLMIYIGPGSGKEVRSMGCFAVAWLGIVGTITGVMLLGGAAKEAPLLLLIPFAGIFWAVGLGLLYFAVRGRFGKQYLLVEPDRLVNKFELFGREKYKEFVLDVNSRASLVESFRSNNRPVYAVSVSGRDRPAKFGTFLPRKEKDWIVERINRHLGK